MARHIEDEELRDVYMSLGRFVAVVQGYASNLQQEDQTREQLIGQYHEICMTLRSATGRFEEVIGQIVAERAGEKWRGLAHGHGAN